MCVIRANPQKLQSQNTYSYECHSLTRERILRQTSLTPLSTLHIFIGHLGLHCENLGNAKTTHLFSSNQFILFWKGSFLWRWLTLASDCAAVFAMFYGHSVTYFVFIICWFCCFLQSDFAFIILVADDGSCSFFL